MRSLERPLATLSDHWYTEFSIQNWCHPGNTEGSGKESNAAWSTRRLRKENISRNPVIGRAKSAGSLKDTVETMKWRVVVASEHSMPLRGHRRSKYFMDGWKD